VGWHDAVGGGGELGRVSKREGHDPPSLPPRLGGGPAG
jgi:hypothetical protein